MKDCAKETNRRTSIRTDKGSAYKRLGRSAYLADPGVSAVGCSENRPIVANGGSMINVGKGNAKKRVSCSTGLVHPVVPSISCSEDGSIATHSCSVVCIDK